jgi:hypothetical protein
VPGEIVATSQPLVDMVLLPPAKRWDSLVPSARSSYWAMIAEALRADPGVGRRTPWLRAARPLYAVERIRPPVGPALTSVVLSLLALSRRVGIRLRRSDRA